MIWFSSDHHFYHNNVIKYCDRPFNTVEEMNEKLILNWNSVVSQEDVVYYIGDFSMAFRSVELFTKRLNGKKILICGNHDFCHPSHKKSRNPENKKIWDQKYIDNGFSEVHTEIELDVPEIGSVLLCHLPYQDPDPAQDQKHNKYRPKDNGKYLLCGHVHEKWKVKNKMINVGVDVWDFKPVSIDDVSEIMCGVR